MLVFEAKLEGCSQQYEKLDEAIRTVRIDLCLGEGTPPSKSSRGNEEAQRVLFGITMALLPVRMSI